MEKIKYSVLDFKKFKEEGKKFTFVTAYDYTTASIVDESLTEIILVGDSLAMIMLGMDTTVGITTEQMISFTQPVVKGAPNTFVITDMPFGSYNISIEEAIYNANRLFMNTHCDAVKIEGGTLVADTVRAVVNAGIPVCGHIGLTPQTSTMLGGFKVQGTSTEEAQSLIEDAIALEEAGVFGIVVECVPSSVGKVLKEAVQVPIMGIGAGPYVDAQVLVTQDLLGMYGDFKPKFVKHFADVRSIMVEGLNLFHKETQEGLFPTEEYSFNKKVEIPRIY